MDKISKQQLLKNMKLHENKKVIIIGEHPHTGEKGTTIKAEIPKGMSSPAMLVSLESGINCYVYKVHNLFFIMNEIKLGNS